MSREPAGDYTRVSVNRRVGMQEVLDRRNALRSAGTWQDALEFLCVLSVTGSACFAYGDWRLVPPVLLLAHIHLLQLYMFMSQKFRALIEFTFIVFILDAGVCIGQMAVQYGYVDSVLGTNLTPTLVDSKTLNIVKAATLLSALGVTIFRLRQYWDIESEEQREREYIEDMQRVNAIVQRNAALSAATSTANGIRYARVVKAV
jgi:hypothetical protein